jgi:hypothetical protein
MAIAGWVLLEVFEVVEVDTVAAVVRELESPLKFRGKTTGRPSKTGCFLEGSVAIPVDSFRLRNNELGDVSPGLLNGSGCCLAAADPDGARVLAVPDDKSKDRSEMWEVSEHDDSTRSGAVSCCGSSFTTSIDDSVSAEH